jgi:hypothetical protein
VIEPLAFATTALCLLSGLTVLVVALSGHYRWPRWRPLAAFVELALLTQAIADLFSSHHPAEPGTHLAYLVTSLAVLPAALAWGARDNTRSAGALLAVALLTLAVLVIRLQTTWR